MQVPERIERQFGSHVQFLVGLAELQSLHGGQEVEIQRKIGISEYAQGE